MNKATHEMEIPSNIIVLTEFVVGLLMTLWGVNALLPILDLNIVFLIGVMFSLPLILYILVGIILGAFEDWTISEKIGNSIPIIVLIGMYFFDDVIVIADLSIIAVLCGIAYILLAVWNLLTLNRRSGAEGEI